MSTTALIEHLQSGLARLTPGPIVVAFSGGLDSSVLLHALASLAPARERGLRALHVDHGLHADSAQWTAHCAAFAAQHGVPIDAIGAGPVTASGKGIEDAARAARYAAFAGNLRLGEVLALAQHADDQTETVLLKLLRGAGPEGLGGMRVLREFAPGYLWRPLLELPRTRLREYALAQGLNWIEDPSNSNTQLRRNFLRAEILPRLNARWPDAGAAIAHSARWAERLPISSSRKHSGRWHACRASIRRRSPGAPGSNCRQRCAIRCCAAGCARSDSMSPRTSMSPSSNASCATLPKIARPV
jgi:tRNA(Ile)-lysidine synthase